MFRLLPSSFRPAATSAFVLLAGLLASCTPMRWDRPDTDPPTAQADSRECSAISRRQAEMFWPQPAFGPSFRTVRDGKGRVREIPVAPWYGYGGGWYPYSPWGAADRPALRKDLFDRCMQAKGYQLVPVEEDGPGAPPA